MAFSTLPLRTRLAVRAGRAAADMSRRLGRGEGSVIGGRVTLQIDPHSLERLSQDRRIALVSGTNGKTTTTSLLVSALATRGGVVTNVAGANMFGGMVGALSSSEAALGVLEVDESHLPVAIARTQPRFVLLLNLSRDQLDRVGEVRMQAQRWREAVAESRATIVANADDPLVAWAASGARSVVWVAAGTGWRLDATSCPECGGVIDWGDQDWSCRVCAFCRPTPHASIATADAARADVDLALPLKLALPGEMNLRNAAIALTTAVLMDAEPIAASQAIGRHRGAGGRFASLRIGRDLTPARLVLAKNPAGWVEALQIVRPSPAPVVAAINARIQDGSDPSWLWDVPYERLGKRFVVATGERGRDLAVRLAYAGVDHAFEADLSAAVKLAHERSGGREVDVLANYSAFQDLRRLAS